MFLSDFLAKIFKIIFASIIAYYTIFLYSLNNESMIINSKSINRETKHKSIKFKT